MLMVYIIVWIELVVFVSVSVIGPDPESVSFPISELPNVTQSTFAAISVVGVNVNESPEHTSNSSSSEVLFIGDEAHSLGAEYNSHIFCGYLCKLFTIFNEI